MSANLVKAPEEVPSVSGSGGAASTFQGLLAARRWGGEHIDGIKMGSEHPSPNVKTLCNVEPQLWPEIITTRDAESTCFKRFEDVM